MRRVVALVLVAFLLPFGVAKEPPKRSLEILEICSGSQRECIPLSHPCSLVVRSSDSISVLLRVREGEDPLPWAPVSVRSDRENSTHWTNEKGEVRISLPKSPEVVVESGGALLVFRPFFGEVRPILVDVPSLRLGETGTARLRFGFSGIGTPPNSSILGSVTYEDERGNVFSAPIRGGETLLPIVAREEGILKFRLLDVDSCGLSLGPPWEFSVHVGPPLRRSSAFPSVALPHVEGWIRERSYTVVPIGEGRVEVRVSGGTWAPPPLRLPEGVYEVEARSIGENTTSPIVRETYRIDSTPPTLDPIPPWSSDCLLLLRPRDEVSGVDPHFLLKVDGVPRTLSLMGGVEVSEGIHTLSLLASDLAGNALSLESTFGCDRTPPSVELEEDGRRVSSGSLLTAPSLLSPSVTDSASGVVEVRFLVQGVPTDPPVLLRGEGNWTVSVEARDRAGNVASRTWNLRVDTLPPLFNFEGGRIGTEELLFRVTDGGTGVRRVELLQGEALLAFGLPDSQGFIRFSLPPGIEGTLTLRAIDGASHSSIASISVSRPEPPLHVIVQSIVSSPTLEARGSRIFVSAWVDGVQSAEAYLLLPSGTKSFLGSARIEGHNLSVEGEARVPEGVYPVVLVVQTPRGDTSEHPLGSIEVRLEGPRGAQPIGVPSSGPPGVLLSFALAWGALRRLRAHATPSASKAKREGGTGRSTEKIPRVGS